MHLTSVRHLEEANRILEDAERDLGRLACPVDFWKRLGCSYENTVRRRPDRGGTDGLELETQLGVLIRQKSDA